MRFRRATIAVIATLSLWLLASGSALATSHIIKKIDPGVAKQLFGTPCPTGYKVQGKVLKVDEGGTTYTCVPNIPNVRCGPGTEYFYNAATCSFGCQGIIKPPK